MKLITKKHFGENGKDNFNHSAGEQDITAFLFITKITKATNHHRNVYLVVGGL